MSQSSADFVFRESVVLLEVFAQIFSSRNPSSWRSVFASSLKQGGISEITRNNTNTCNIQKRRATF